MQLQHDNICFSLLLGAEIHFYQNKASSQNKENMKEEYRNILKKNANADINQHTVYF